MPHSRTLSLAPLERMPSAYFSMVMATGIISIGAWRLNLRVLAAVFFALNIVIYLLLFALYALRLLRYPQQVLADLSDHLRGPGFFTSVAATGILGTQVLLLTGQVGWTWVLWALALALWVALTYWIFAAFIIKEKKPPLERGINGGWLLAVVATQSIAALSTLLASRSAPEVGLILHMLALSMWLWGGMLYIWMISLIFYRYNFLTLRPDDLSPPYWINMGAMAISTLVGALLYNNAEQAPLVQGLQPFIVGFTIFYWATGTWWIPMLLILGFWRHVYRRVSLRYDPLYWGAVFPLGMYATGTGAMAEALGVHFLSPVTDVMFAVALLVWGLVFIGQLRALQRGWRRIAGDAPARRD